MTAPPQEFDAVVVGAGFAGMYALHRLREMELAVRVFERADDVGGTWYWNRYPGARCDIDSLDYSYSFSEDLQQDWEWTERFATQPEILRYAAHVADRFDLRRDIAFETVVESARWDERDGRWTVGLQDGRDVSATWLVMATGSLSAPKDPELPGLESFSGEWHQTSRWPHSGVDLAGRRIGVIGTGSTGIQLITEIAPQAAELTVYQRTPQFSVPAHNRPIDPSYQREVKDGYARRRVHARYARGSMSLPFPEPGWGVRPDPSTEPGADLGPAEIRSELERRWAFGGAAVMLTAFADEISDVRVNDAVGDFVREKIAGTVRDPEVAELLTPRDFPFGTKRLPADSGYYETYNRDNVTLVDLRTTPLVEATADGIRTTERIHEHDVIVFATGFDALTGALAEIEISGVDGVALGEVWRDGPRSFLGLMVADFPNLFTITGPGSPSVLSNVVLSIEQHVDWMCDLIGRLDPTAAQRVEATHEAQERWTRRVIEAADATLLPRAASWYMGANVPGKPRTILPFAGGVGVYREICDAEAAAGYPGLSLGAPMATAPR